jgi:hypothetical protein
VLPGAQLFVIDLPLPHVSEHAVPDVHVTLHFVEPEQSTVQPPLGQVTLQSLLP